MDEKNTRIECNQTLLGKAIAPALSLLIIAFFINTSSLLCGSLFAIVFLVQLLVASPDFVVLDEGIEVNFGFRKQFIEWKKIRAVRQTSFSTRIESRKLPIFNYLVGWPGMPAIYVMSLFRRNYRPAIEYIETKIPDKFIDPFKPL